MKLRRKKALECSFCGKDQSEVQQLISGPKVFICSACVALCNDILEQQRMAVPDAHPVD